MPWFEYEGVTPGGTAITGRLEATDHEQAARDLALMQIQVNELHKAAKPPTPSRLTADDLIFFNDQLASLAQAGIALDEGLAQLARDLESSSLKRWILGLERTFAAASRSIRPSPPASRACRSCIAG